MKVRKFVLLMIVIFLMAAAVQAQEIIEAAKTGNLAKTKELLEKNPRLINTKDETGRTALHWAARGVHVEVLAYLVSHGADVNAKDINGVTPLHSVCSRGHAEAAKILIENGADPMAAMSDLSTPLHLAVVNSSKELVILLIQNGASLRMKDDKEDSPLHAAAHEEKWGVMDLMVNHITEQKSDILNSADFDGNTVLHLGCRAGRQETIKAILSKNADVDIRNTVGQTAYNIAVQGGFSEAAELLVQHGADTTPQMFPKLEGPYLGQKPPGTVPQLFAKGIVSTRKGMYGTIVLSPDGHEAIWKPESPKMLFSEVENGMWSAPRELLFKGKEQMNVPFYSTDGKRLYFMVGSQGKESIWYVEKRGENWAEPRSLDSIVNSFPMHWQFSLDKNGDVYFSSDKIFRAHFMDGRYENPEPLPPPINPRDEAHQQYREGNVGPLISPDGDFLIYTKFSASSQYPVQLFISFREKDSSWTEPQNLSKRLQTEGNDSSPRISPDGKYLFFQSVRKGSGASRGLYWVSAKIIEDLRPKESGAFTDSRDRNVYRWVKIGSQVWMAENLRFETESGSWCWENEEENCKERGRLYAWTAAMKAAPPGWHLPSDEEWKEMEIVLGLTKEQANQEGFRVDKEGLLAGKIKLVGGWPDNHEGKSIIITNETGFSAIKTGLFSHGEFSHDGYTGWWTSDGNDTHAWIRHIGFFDNTIGRVLNRKEFGFPMRCVKD